MSKLKELMKDARPYDDVSKKDEFLNRITPKLEKSFEEQLISNPGWLKAAEKEVFFILYDSRWKLPAGIANSKEASIMVLYVGPNRAPTIEICY